MNITLAGTAVTLLPEGAVWLPQHRVLGIADLHFEKSSFFARFGTLLPPYDSAATLDRLDRLLTLYRPAQVVAAGDSFHDRAAVARLPADLRGRLQRLTAQPAQWHWLAGNHDPALAGSLPGCHADTLGCGAITFRHQTAGLPGGEISGHYHPKARLRIMGHRITAPCFVQQGDRLIMPAFGAYTGGLDIDSAAFAAIMPAAQRQVYLLQPDRVYAV